MERRSLTDIYATTWEPFFHKCGRLQEDVDISLECYICRNELAINQHADDDHETATMLPCGHIFGLECVKEWFKNKSTCPVCRKGWRHRNCDHPIEPIAIRAGPGFNFKDLPKVREPAVLGDYCNRCQVARSHIDEYLGVAMENIQGPTPENPLQRRIFMLQHYENLRRHLREHEEDFARAMGPHTTRLLRMVEDLRPHVDFEMRAAINRNFVNRAGVPRSDSPQETAHFNGRHAPHRPHGLVAAQFTPRGHHHWNRYRNIYEPTLRTQYDTPPQGSDAAGPHGMRGSGGNIHQHQFARHLETLEREERSPFRGVGRTLGDAAPSEAATADGSAVEYDVTDWQLFADAAVEQTLQDLSGPDRRAQMAEELEFIAQRRHRYDQRTSGYPALHPDAIRHLRGNA